MSNIILDYKKEGFSVKVLDNSVKFFIKEKNIDFSKFRELEQGDTIEKLLLIRDREGGTWSPGGTDYFLLENLTLRKIVSNLQDIDGDIVEYHLIYKKATSLTKFEYSMVVQKMKDDLDE